MWIINVPKKHLWPLVYFLLNLVYICSSGIDARLPNCINFCNYHQNHEYEQWSYVYLGSIPIFFTGFCYFKIFYSWIWKGGKGNRCIEKRNRQWNKSTISSKVPLCYNGQKIYYCLMLAIIQNKEKTDPWNNPNSSYQLITYILLWPLI